MSKSERRKQVESVARQLFSERGYLATSVRDIAEALGIEAASLYSHMKSKEELLWTIASESANEFFVNVEPVFDSTLRTPDKMKQMIIEHIKVITQNIDAAAVFFREWRHLSEPRRSDYDQRRREYENMFRKVVRQGIEENLFKHYDEGFSTRTILSALNWTHTWYRPDGELRPEEIGSNLAGILLNGIIRSY